MGALGTSKEVVASVSSVLALLRVWDCPALGILFHLSLGTQERPVRVLSPKPVGCENGFPTEDRSVKYFSKAVKEAAPSPDVRRGTRGFLRPASPPHPRGLLACWGSSQSPRLAPRARAAPGSPQCLSHLTPTASFQEPGLGPAPPPLFARVPEDPASAADAPAIATRSVAGP